MTDTILSGFGFSGYRSFSGEVARIGPLKKINFIIGQNNVGKSNIVNFVHRHYECMAKKTQSFKAFDGSGSSNPFNEMDRPLTQRQSILKIAFNLGEMELDEFSRSKISHPQPDVKEKCIGFAKKILAACCPPQGGQYWFVYRQDPSVSGYILDVDPKQIHGALTHNEWQLLFNSVSQRSDGNLHVWVPETLKILSYYPQNFPKVEVIPAIRKIGAAGTTSTDFGGDGIIDRIAKIQNPPLNEQQLREKHSNLGKFVKDVLESPSAEIEIPYDRNMIIVHMDGKTLPLENLGTGIHEVIILAAAATLLNDNLICIEEPELHLHPLLQKKLIKYLHKNTTNQYLLTTHSAHLLDAVEAEVFHVTMKDGISRVEAISSTKQRFNICNDLGYKASDLLQANCVIWVEGPSDRIYLNYWLEAKAPDLQEGLHYSIMFYGGRLCSHLTANDSDEQVNEAIQDLISIRNLNRNSVILFDSDKDKPSAEMNATKIRLQQEFDNGPGFAWVTDGREVENYLDYEKLEETVKLIHPSAVGLAKKDKWSNLLKYQRSADAEITKNIKKLDTTADKVKVARQYIKTADADIARLDLNAKITKLVDFIQRCNK